MALVQFTSRGNSTLTTREREHLVRIAKLRLINRLLWGGKGKGDRERC
ncbi:MAG: hypothetical protein ACXVJ0_13960 [Candidatus Angelobacter sp.]